MRSPEGESRRKGQGVGVEGSRESCRGGTEQGKEMRRVGGMGGVEEGKGSNLYGCKFPIHNRLANGYKLFYCTFLPSSFLNLSTLLLSLIVISLYSTDSNPGMHWSFQIALSCLLASENNVHFPSSFFPIHLTSKGRIFFSVFYTSTSLLQVTNNIISFSLYLFLGQSKRAISCMHVT